MSEELVQSLLQVLTTLESIKKWKSLKYIAAPCGGRVPCQGPLHYEWSIYGDRRLHALLLRLLRPSIT